MSEPPFLPEHFQRRDERDDSLFYTTARLVTHIDDAAIEAARRLYAELLPEDGTILDLMSSWKSHLPDGSADRRVAGLGMNEEEMRENGQLDDWRVHDVNQQPRLPFEDGAFAGAVMTVSVQYLVRPVELFRDVARVLRPGAPFVVTYSHRLFPEKAVAIWYACNAEQRARLIGAYFHYAGGWGRITAQDRSPQADAASAIRSTPSGQTEKDRERSRVLWLLPAGQRRHQPGQRAG
ncbi:MAG: methyltransferase domain-containing protein [Chloroflexi bacterium]|nr:methyltransferase domain-containing protein [Chloroflexota bacterium]